MKYYHWQAQYIFKAAISSIQLNMLYNHTDRRFTQLNVFFSFLGMVCATCMIFSHSTCNFFCIIYNQIFHIHFGEVEFRFCAFKNRCIPWRSASHVLEPYLTPGKVCKWKDVVPFILLIWFVTYMHLMCPLQYKPPGDDCIWYDFMGNWLVYFFDGFVVLWKLCFKHRP